MSYVSWQKAVGYERSSRNVLVILYLYQLAVRPGDLVLGASPHLS